MESVVNNSLAKVLTELGVPFYLTVGICIALLWRASINKKNGIVDNSAQLATATGVFFTFFGITWGLLNFDPESLQTSIPTFLNGMKLAFATSIIGMFFSAIIKGGIYSSVEKKTGNATIEAFTDLKGINKALQELIELQRRQSKESVLEDLQVLSENMKSVNLAMNKFSSAAEIFDRMSLSLEEQNKSLNNSMKEVHHALNRSVDAQNEHMNIMNSQIAQMVKYEEKAAGSAAENLKITRDFQNESLENQKQQNSILQGNTAQILGMRESFDDFLKNMAKNNNEAFIKALNESMQQLNSQIEHQFGENFKRFGESVYDLIKWQEQYKEMFGQYQASLKAGATLFQKATDNHKAYVDSVSDKVNKNLQYAKLCLEELQTAILASVEHQKELTNNLRESTKALSESCNSIEVCANTYNGTAMTVKESIDQVNDAIRKNGEAVSTAIRSTNDAMAQVEKSIAETMDATLDDFEAIVGKHNNVVYSITEDSVKHTTEINRNIQQALKQIEDNCSQVSSHLGRTLEGFDVDFGKAIEGSMTNTNQYFKQMIENLSEQTNKQVEALAGALGKITETMTDNYSTLVDKIGEVDSMLVSNRR